MYSYAHWPGCRSVDVAEVAGRLPVHAAQVAHGTVEGDPHGLADARVPALHHLQLVYRLVNAQRDHLGLRKPLPLREKTDGEARAHHLPMATLHMPGLHTPGSALEPQSTSPAGTPAAPRLTARHTATQPAGHRAAQQSPAGQPAGGGRVSKTPHPLTWGHCRAPAQGGLASDGPQGGGCGGAWSWKPCSHGGSGPCREPAECTRSRGAQRLRSPARPGAGRAPAPAQRGRAHQLLLLSKKSTRKSFSSALVCMCSPIFSTSSGGAGMVTPLWWPGTRGILGSMICTGRARGHGTGGSQKGSGRGGTQPHPNPETLTPRHREALAPRPPHHDSKSPTP